MLQEIKFQVILGPVQTRCPSPVLRNGHYFEHYLSERSTQSEHNQNSAEHGHYLDIGSAHARYSFDCVRFGHCVQTSAQNNALA